LENDELTTEKNSKNSKLIRKTMCGGNFTINIEKFLYENKNMVGFG
jgi:hypothetical protein